MKNKLLRVFVVIVLTGTASVGFAQSSGVEIIRQGLLGAGSGAIGGAVSGGDSEDLWIGALTGAGVNIIGGSLLDVMTQGNSTDAIRRDTTGYPAQSKKVYRRRDKRYDRRDHYRTGSQPVTVVTVTEPSQEYTEGYKDGYKDGYLLGYQEAVRDIMAKK